MIFLHLNDSIIPQKKRGKLKYVQGKEAKIKVFQNQ